MLKRFHTVYLNFLIIAIQLIHNSPINILKGVVILIVLPTVPQKLQISDIPIIGKIHGTVALVCHKKQTFEFCAFECIFE